MRCGGIFMFDVVCLGELLVDFTPAGNSSKGNALYECNPGGGVANFAVAIARLGAKSSFIGQVGQDQFGQLLQKTMQNYGVDTQGLLTSDRYMTTLAFVHLFENGERDFTFYRKNGADIFIEAEDVRCDLIDQAKIFHFSSLCMVNDTCKAATLRAIRCAHDKGVLVTYDPNWRPSLWENEADCKREMIDGIALADVIKVSEEELFYMTDIADHQKAAQSMLDRGARLIIETLGEKGSRFYCKQGSGEVPAFSVKAVDATGAGDACFGAIVYGLIKNEIDLNAIDTEKMIEILRFANASAAISVTQYGGMPSLPDFDTVSKFIADHPAN